MPTLSSCSSSSSSSSSSSINSGSSSGSSSNSEKNEVWSWRRRLKAVMSVVSVLQYIHGEREGGGGGGEVPIGHR